MKQLTPESRRLVSLLYVVAAVVVLEELAEVFALAYPFHTDVASWRFGILGVTVSRAGNLLLADVMALGAAYLLEHRAVLRALGLLNLIVAVVLIPVMGMLSLDALVLRRSIKPDFVRGFDLTAARTLGHCLLAFAVGILVFWATFRAKAVKVEGKEAPRGMLLTDLPAKESE